MGDAFPKTTGHGDKIGTTRGQGGNPARPVHRDRRGQGRAKVRTRNTAIWSRRFGSFGQYFPPPQPAVTPSAASSSIHGVNGSSRARSLNTPVGGGGT